MKLFGVTIPDQAKHRNPDGTVNGVTYMAELTGLSQEEIRWSLQRAKELKASGKSPAECKAILKAEATAKFGQPKPKG